MKWTFILKKHILFILSIIYLILIQEELIQSIDKFDFLEYYKHIQVSKVITLHLFNKWGEESPDTTPARSAGVRDSR